jgi:TetR/AcrR family transcriptional regulator, mexJK operon transcriptional repressor
VAEAKELLALVTYAGVMASVRFPELGPLAVREGVLRRVRPIRMILERFVGTFNYRVGDLKLAADLFVSIVLGRSARTALLGMTFETEHLKQRIDAEVAIFLDGVIRRH